MPESTTSQAQLDQKKPKNWKEIIIGGGILAAVLTLIGTFGIQGLHDWWYRPQIEVWYSQIAIGTTGIRTGNEITDYAYLQDEVKNCRVIAYRLRGNATNTRVWNFPVEAIVKIYVFNSGRSRLTDVSFAENPWNAEWISAESTPNLRITTSTSSSSGFLAHVVTVRSIPPGSTGVVTLKSWLLGTGLAVMPRSGGGIAFVWHGLPAHSSFTFQGSSELNGSQIPAPVPEAAIDVLQRESEFLGESRIQVPTVDGSGLTDSFRQAVSWRIEAISPDSQGCPIPPEVLRRFVFIPPVQAKDSENGHLGVSPVPVQIR